MNWDKIVEYITTIVASIGGIGAVITIACTIVKTMGSNGVKARIASAKIDTDTTISNGLGLIGDKIEKKICTDITVDISQKVDRAVERQLCEQKQINKLLIDDVNSLKHAQAEVLRTMSDFKAVSLARREELRSTADELESNACSLEIEPRAVATVVLEDKPTFAETSPQELVKSKSRRGSVL